MQPRCPHCNVTLTPFSVPDAGGWRAPFHLACFNDECPYFVRGWQWMKERFGVNSSYRYRLDPATGKASPLGVWSRNALRDRILDAEVEAQEMAAGPETPGEGGSSPSRGEGSTR
jgi:hypothetical protein